MSVKKTEEELDERKSPYDLLKKHETQSGHLGPVGVNAHRSTLGHDAISLMLEYGFGKYGCELPFCRERN